jgi:hypothetical protein
LFFNLVEVLGVVFRFTEIDGVEVDAANGGVVHGAEIDFAMLHVGG